MSVGEGPERIFRPTVNSPTLACIPCLITVSPTIRVELDLEDGETDSYIDWTYSTDRCPTSLKTNIETSSSKEQRLQLSADSRF